MVWKEGSFFVTFEQEVLMKYNSVRMFQKEIVLGIVRWFPNLWVRKWFVVTEKYANYGCFQSSNVKYSIQFKFNL